MADGSHGTVLQVLIGSTYTDLVGVQDIDFDKGTYDEHDITHQKSQGQEEILLGVLHGKSCSFPVHWNKTDTSHTQLSTHFNNATKGSFKLVAPGVNGYTHSFSAYITTSPERYPVSGVRTQDITLKIDGAITTT